MSLKNYCRLCFEEKANYSSLFEEETAKMLKSLTKIQIEPNEKISVSVCESCLEELETAYNIQQKILNAESRHQEELLADFLIENHDELKNELLIHYTFNKLQLGETGDSEILNNNILIVPKDTLIDDEDSIEFLQHTEEHKTRKCNICTEDVSIDNYYQHLSEHPYEVKETDVLCERCGEVFSDAEGHDMHMKEVHIGQHVCDVCGADFFRILELQQHIKSKHSGMKPFLCDVCHEAFALRYVLQLHKSQHTHDSPYACEFCPKKFKYSCSLKIHLRIKHDNDRVGCKRRL